MVPTSQWPWELPDWGTRGSESRKGWAALTGAVFNSSSTPPRFISPISAKCGNFSPSGWQPWQQLPGGPGRPEELRPAEGLWVLFPAPPSAPSASRPSPLSQRSHTGAIIPKTWSALASREVSSLRPNYCVASYAETGCSWLLLSEPETKRNRICLCPAQQMVAVIAKALINPPAEERV